MANKKRIATSVAAVATAAALLLGGTFAWQSISQRALNEASDVINPGGRLHNDLWYEDAKTTNNDIYVENFTDPDADGDDIYARVRLSEYMEIVMNYGTAAEKVENVAGSKTPLDDTTHSADEATEQGAYTYEYDIHYFGDDNATDEYWTWDTDGSDAGDVYYMPTFNKNKDSLAPDLNGLYCDRVGGISNREMGQYEAYTEWIMGATTADTEIYDGDTNNVDEVGFDFDNLSTYETAGNILTVPSVEHTVDTVDTTRGLVSMEWWLNEVGYDAATGEAVSYDEDAHGNYWVYDTDGWVYWSGAIGAGETTGLLLDSFTLKEVMDDTWYYAIEAEGEFVTADDLGEFDPAATASTFNLRSAPVASPSDLTYYNGGTGFYENGISKDALTLLSIIGVDVYGEAEDEGSGEPEAPKTIDITTSTEDYPEIHVNVYDTLKLNDQLMALEYEVDGETITLVLDQQYTWSNSDPTCISTVVLTDETLVGKKITVVAKDVIGSEYKYAYLIVDGVAVKDGSGEEEETTTHYLALTMERSDFVRANAGDTIKLGYPGSEDAQVLKTYAIATAYSTDDLAMSFDSSPTYTVDDTGSAYIEINKTRFTPFKWNLWGCSEGEFSLTSNNPAVTFEEFGGGEASQGSDMNIVVPTSVTEEFTVTATAVNDSSKSVTFTVKMLDQADRAIEVVDYTTETSSGITLTEGEDYTYNHDTKELVILTDNFVELWVCTPDYSYVATIFHAEEDDKGPASTVNASFSTTNDLNAPAYTVLTKESADSDLYTLSFVRSTETITAGEDTLNGVEVAYVSVLGETHVSSPEYDEYYYDEWGGTESGYKVKTVQFLNTIKPRSLFTWFLHMSYLESIDFGMLDASWVIDIGQMFSECHRLTEIDMSGLDFGGNTVDSYCAFNGMNNLETIKLPKNVVLSGDMGVRNLFGSCPKLTTIEGLENLDVSENSDFSFTFCNCSSLTSVDLSSWDMSNATTFECMFSNCTELTELKLPDSLDTSNVTDMRQMFWDCENLTYDCSGWDVSNVTSYDYFNENASGVIAPNFS